MLKDAIADSYSEIDLIPHEPYYNNMGVKFEFSKYYKRNTDSSSEDDDDQEICVEKEFVRQEIKYRRSNLFSESYPYINATACM